MAQPDVPSRDTAARPRSLLSRPLFWWALAAAALLLGYADLARGGVTLAPILLIIGYCVLVPIAILK
jgi:hypothetical protein